MSQCDTCHAGCCRAFAAPIHGADILRLKSQLGLSFWDVACRWEDPAGDITRGAAPHFRFPDNPAMPYAICLLHEESQQFSGTTKCQFLQELPATEEQPAGTVQCSIYNHRPGTCRAFPAALNNQGLLKIIDIPDYGHVEKNDAYKLCPSQWQAADFDQSQTRFDLQTTLEEMQFFRLIAEVWNKTPQAWEVFPEFLQMVYDRRDEVERREVA